jgi:hypothetical protein
MNYKYMIIALVLVVSLGLSACQKEPDNVETIVSEGYFSYWDLSPNGDKLVYGGSGERGDVLINIATREKKVFECGLQWLDNQYLLCYGEQMSILDTQSSAKIGLYRIEPADQVRFSFTLTELLRHTKRLYRPEWLSDTLYAFQIEPKVSIAENYEIVKIKDRDKLLEGYDYISVPDRRPRQMGDEKVISPNGKYYYYEGGDLIIATVDGDREVSRFVIKEATYLLVAGWQADSSGVFFQDEGRGLNYITPEIKKLKVPEVIEP